ncbi:MAG: recombinase family protein [Armatimonadetes bacterium]|nr:recombinase family protein [Armatimonadota bacterium]
MANCFIYCRVSTEEQADKGYSLDAQEKLCRDFAARSGLRVADVFRDEGKSGTTLERPALTELLSRCTKDGDIKAVVVQETDRLARNTKDHLTIRAILQKAEVNLISVAQPMLDDSPEGNLIDTILASVNQFQSDINSRKTKRGMREKFEQGWWPAPAPFGYLNVKKGAATGGGRPVAVIAKDSDRYELLRQGFELYLTGKHSVDDVADILYQRGLRSKTGRKVPHSVMYGTFRNPFYAGIMRWNGQERPGRHKAMITPEEHKRVLEIMDRNNRYACRRRRHDFLLRGFVFCNICGQRYTAEVHPAKQKQYYHCAAMRAHSNRGQNIEVPRLERAVEERFKSIQFSDGFVTLILKRLRVMYLDQRQSIASEKQILQNQINALEAKRDRAEEKLLDGVIGDDEFVRLRAKFNDALAGLRTQMDELDEVKESDLDVVQDVLRLSRSIYRAYRAAPPELKHHYLGLFWDRFMVQDRKIVKAIPTELIRVLQREKQVIAKSDWLPSPTLIITFRNVDYLKRLRARLGDIAASGVTA